MQGIQCPGAFLEQFNINLHRLQRIKVTQVLPETASPSNLDCIAVNSIPHAIGYFVIHVVLGVVVFIFSQVLDVWEGRSYLVVEFYLL